MARVHALCLKRGSVLRVSSRNWNFKRKALAALLVIMAGAMAVSCFVLYWSAVQSDAVSVQRQVRETHKAVDSSVDELAKQQETIALWDDAVLRLRQPAANQTWLDDNIGVWLHDLFDQDEVFILDAADQPVYSMVGGSRRAPAEYLSRRDDVQLMVDAVRGRSSDAPGLHDRNPGQPLNPDATVLTTARAVHDSHLMSVGGKPALASVMRIMPLTDALTQRPGSESLIVSIRYLDRPFFADLAARNLITGARFGHTLSAREGEHWLALQSEHGKLIGYVFWKPDLPGSVMLRNFAPIVAMTLLVTALGLTMLARWLWRSTSDLEDALIELRASEAQAQHLAFHDSLTGLPNRALLHDRLEMALARARRGEKVALLALDLDRFKQVNDTLGHHAGDVLIREFANRLIAVVRAGDTVARLGGDEFALILHDAGAEECELICQRIQSEVRRPFDLGDGLAFVGVSIGVMFADPTCTDRAEWLRKADIALYRAKAEGRACVRAFTPEMDDSVRFRSAIEDELRAALEAGTDLRVHFQPLVGREGRIVGLEALLRWDHPQRGLISPDQFIPIAEETGIINQLGEWVVGEAACVSARFPALSIAINLSPVQFRSEEFSAKMLRIVREAGADPHNIELEVTEGVLLDDDELVRRQLAFLRSAGFRIALDDFGTGYSSLSYLRRFEVDKIKIDRSFIKHLGQTVDSAAIVTAVITLGHALGLSVTAEGVETADQQKFLSSLGCNELQGYLFSRAVPSDELEGMLAEVANRRVA